MISPRAFDPPLHETDKAPKQPRKQPENVLERASSLAEQAFVMSATGWGPFAGSRDFFREIATATWLEI